ncbi:MAG: Rrf2 family transcriptional regulator [Rhodospirillales bacterium]|nr:Rrf2 family transcriptional regulator [Rhodospirillales bacterium]MDE2391654.1 Rrf2 family transcriptional regulator [Rhodospirillales bacterium]MDE2459406.1 Rrf2 family transcriptional regulator [Rhodospirillales bacterium]
MLKLSRLTDYAVAALVRLGMADGVETSPGIAAGIGVPEPTVAKVLKALAGHGLVISTRGARGGYRLAKALAEIPVSEVIVAIDGPIALTSCVEGTGMICESLSLCPIAGRWDPVNEAIRGALSHISLADMAAASIPPAFRIPAEPINEVA